MLDLDQFKTSQLHEPATLEKVKKEVADIVFYQDIDRALVLVEQIELKLGIQLDDEKISATQDEYLGFLKILRFLSLPVLPEEEIKNLLQRHLADVLDVENFDIVERLERKFLVLPWDYRDQVKKDFQQALHNNSQRLTGKKIGAEGREAPPTIANWLKNFVRNFGTEKVDKLKKVQYLTSDPNVSALNGREKAKVTNLLNLYISLKISSLSPEGTDSFITYIDEDGRIKSLENGRIVDLGISTAPGAEKAGVPVKRELPSRLDIPKTAAPLDPLELLKQKYLTYRRQREKVLKQEDEILVKTQGEAEDIKKELATASRQNEKVRVIACLKILARQKKLINSLKENPAWFEEVINYIASKYGRQYKPEEVTAALSNLKMNSTTPAAVSEFLQYLLREKLKMNGNDSALIGVEVGQLLGKQFQGIAYGNQETGNFEWTENIIKDQKLISEAE